MIHTGHSNQHGSPLFPSTLKLLAFDHCCFPFHNMPLITKLDKQCPLLFLKTMELRQIFVDIYLFFTYFLTQYQSPYSVKWTFSQKRKQCNLKFIPCDCVQLWVFYLPPFSVQILPKDGGDGEESYFFNSSS